MTMTDSDSPLRGLYVIIDTAVVGDRELIAKSRQAVAGGAGILQYRDKGGRSGTRLAHCRAMADLCHEAARLFLVNDDVRLARECGADGVHLGREDMPISRAREILGANGIIGASCYDSIELARVAKAQGASYLAFGSFFPSRTKPGAPQPPRSILRKARSLGLPLVAIGGIDHQNALSLIESGADMIAVITSALAVADTVSACRRLAGLFRKNACSDAAAI